MRRADRTPRTLSGRMNATADELFRLSQLGFFQADNNTGWGNTLLDAATLMYEGAKRLEAKP